MIPRNLLKRLIRPLPPTPLINNTHTPRPLPASLHPYILINSKLPLRIVLIDAVPNRQRIVQLQPYVVAGEFVLQGLDFAECRFQPGGGPGCEGGVESDQGCGGGAEGAAG